MRRFFLRYSLVFVLACLIGITALPGSQRRRNSEPKPEISPLPKELPMALAVETKTLAFQSLPLPATGGLAAQIRQSMNVLLHEARSQTVIKLRAFVAGPGDARRLRLAVGDAFSERKLPLPVLTTVQVGALENDKAQVALEAVVSSREQAGPNGLVFLGGQTDQTLAGAIHKMQESARAASATRILRCTCFVSRIAGDGAALHQSMAAAFPGAELTLVQAMRDAAEESATCEGVAQASATERGSPLMLYSKARAITARTDRLVFTGLQLTFGNFLDDAQEAFERLHQAAVAVDPVEAPVQVNAFSPDLATMAALRKTTKVPLSVFTLQPVEGLPGADASGGVEEVLAPGVGAPTVAEE